MNKMKFVLANIIVFSITLLWDGQTEALTDLQRGVIIPQNDIIAYNDCESGGSSGNVAVCSASLPTETIQMLEEAGVKQKAEENMERYKYGEAKTGLPWQVLAALHFREGGMGSNQSISNGEELYDHVNVDGVHVSSDPNQDAEDAARHFIDLAKSVYDVDVLNNTDMDSYGYAFLAYNRGYMYKCNGDVSYKESPYVMNFFDAEHMNMSWISADSLDCNGNALNNVAGLPNTQLGALAVLAYLCGNESNSSSNSNESSKPSESSESSTPTSPTNSPAPSLPTNSGCTTFEGEYPEYIQSSEPWGGIDYGGCTIGACGCGAASMAMIATVASGTDVLPSDVAELTRDAPYWNTIGSGMAELDKRVGEKYGFEVVTVNYGSLSDAVDKMKQYLNDGYMIHLSGAGSPPFSSVGHYVGIFNISGDTVFIADSGAGNKEYNINDLVNAGMHGDAFSASRGNGAGGRCDDVCEIGANNAGMVEGGLTEEQAQKIADYYNSDAVSAAGLPMGTKENCVSFSAWFVSYLTDVTNATNPTRGDGLNVADNLIADFNLDGGATPQVYSVFSNPTGTPVNGSSNHTGVIVGIEGNEVITIEAAWGGWAGQSDGLARVWRYTMPESGMSYAYLGNHLNSARISEIVGG